MKKNNTSITGAIITGALAFISIFACAHPVWTSDVKPSEMVIPFHTHISDSAIDDLRRRILATRWPRPELVHDGIHYSNFATTIISFSTL